MQIESNNVSYTGLTKKFSRSLFNYSDTLKALKSNTSNGIVGHIPNQWIKQIPCDLRRENITEYHKNMGFFVSKILPFTKDSKLSSFFITKIMRHSNIIPSKTSVKIQFVGEGSFGKGYSIINDATGDVFFLKKFKHKYDAKYFSLLEHGIVTEANSKMYLKSNLKRKDKDFFSNFHYADIKNGYYIEDFLSAKNDVAKGVKDWKTRDNIYMDISRPNHLLYRIQRVLKKYSLHHGDLSVANVKIYNDPKGYKIKCFDIGGLRELN